MKNSFINLISVLYEMPFVKKDVIDKFTQRIQQGRLTKEENEKDHLCAFFLPFHQKSQSIYLGHHIKANDWIPQHNCKVHYDIWYLISMEKVDFHFDKSEYYSASWFQFSAGICKIKLGIYRTVVRKAMKLLLQPQD